jgi:hypothetical protein
LLPEDGIVLPKHVGAIVKKIVWNSVHFVGYSLHIRERTVQESKPDIELLQQCAEILSVSGG